MVMAVTDGDDDDGDSDIRVSLYVEDRVLTLATSSSSFFSISGLELEEGRWHHLVVIHSKPNALAGLFQASFAYVYLNGKLRHTGKLGYSPSPVGKPLQVTTIGTSVVVIHDKDNSNSTWTLINVSKSDLGSAAVEGEEQRIKCIY
ncbi:hypothetical protein RIF29_21009 [Crotalaria pallida]|uniref:Uncharacterized protein n=1 Tax=Crotalaria pallida TaxID=3830 RepID=A0AAN9I6U4_CROPI